MIGKWQHLAGNSEMETGHRELQADAPLPLVGVQFRIGQKGSDAWQLQGIAKRGSYKEPKIGLDA